MTLLSSYIALLVSLVLHELAHAYTAFYFGDWVPQATGRLSLNPTKHLDLWMSGVLPLATLLMFGVAFGAAKPLYIGYGTMTRGQRFCVAMAGVTVNSVIALIAWLLHWEAVWLTNLGLVLFNLIPAPPLDGWYAARAVLMKDTRREAK